MRRPEIPEGVIVTFEHTWGVDYRAWVRAMARKDSMHAPGPDNAVAGAEVRAYINGGRWLAECPDCRSAQVVSDTERVFWCLHCGNSEINFAWRHVRMPRNRRAIEPVLLKRPAARSDRAISRNWKVGEAVEFLEQENVEHGVG